MTVFLPLNGSSFYSKFGVPDLLRGQTQQCVYNVFTYDTFGDHLQTCQTKSTVSQVHDWVVYKLGSLLGSVGQRVKIHKLRLQRVRNEETSRSKLCSLAKTSNSG